jgi:hypothetical protein
MYLALESAAVHRGVCEPCEAILNGVRREVQPLEEREEFSLDGVTYEAFNTSGRRATPLRYPGRKGPHSQLSHDLVPGHAVVMRALLNDLHLRDRRNVLKDILEHAVPTTLQDVAIVFVTVSGRNNGQLVQENVREQDLQPRRGRPDVERYSDHDGRYDLHHARPARDRPIAAERVRSSGRHSVEGFLEKRFGQVYVQAGDGVPHQSFGGSGP